MEQCRNERRQRGRRDQGIVIIERIRVKRAVVAGANVQERTQREPARVDALRKRSQVVQLGKRGEDLGRGLAVVEPPAAGTVSLPHLTVSGLPPEVGLALEPGIDFPDIMRSRRQDEGAADRLRIGLGPERSEAAHQVLVLTQPDLGDEADIEQVTGERVARPIRNRLTVRLCDSPLVVVGFPPEPVYQFVRTHSYPCAIGSPLLSATTHTPSISIGRRALGPMLLKAYP